MTIPDSTADEIGDDTYELAHARSYIGRLTRDLYAAQRERDTARQTLTTLRTKVADILADWHGYPSLGNVLRQLRAALDDTNTTPGPEAVTGERCTYADHALATNQPLRCDKRAGHDGIHRLVFTDTTPGDPT